MDDRTVVEFTCEKKIWPAVDEWAERTKMGLVQRNGTRHYRKGRGFMNARTNVAFSQDGDAVHVEAWLESTGFLQRLRVPPVMGIGSGGMKLTLPRKDARKGLNKLLEELGGPTVE